MNKIDYRKKYQDLRGRFISSMDAAFRMGYEQGSNDANQAAMQQQMQMQAQQMQAQQAAAQGNAPGTPSPGEAFGQEEQGIGSSEGQPQPGQGPGEPVGAPGQDMGTELDQHIGELESLVTKSEISPEELKKSLEKLKILRWSNQFKKNLKPLNKSLTHKFPSLAAANLTAEAKREVSMQERIISDMMAKWEKEAKQASGEIMSAIGTEPLSKKE